MIEIHEMDDHVTFLEQLQGDGADPIVLINKFTVPPDQMERAIKAWAEDSAFMQRQPGFTSAQLHRGAAGSSTLVNVAVWESAAALRNAFTQPGFQARLSHYPDGTIASPHVFTKVAVPGICDG